MFRSLPSVYNNNDNNNNTHNVLSKFTIKEGEYLPNIIVVLTLHMYGHRYSKRRTNRVRLPIVLVVS